MATSAETKGWTVTQVQQLFPESLDDTRYELIDGELLVTPAPGVIHQVAVSELLRLIAEYVEGEHLGITLTSPADVELRPGTITQPDVFVVPTRATPSPSDVIPRWTDVRALLLAVEVISPSSVQTDRVTKRDYYLDAGVPEYWIVDLDARIVERWTPDRETPRVESGRFEWKPAGTTSALIVQTRGLFERIWSAVRCI